MELFFLGTGHLEDIEEYYIAPEMKEFSVEPSKAILLAEEKPSMQVVLAYDKNKLVSCFALDVGEDVGKYTANDRAILFGKFTIDSHCARQGYATKILAVLPDFIAKEYPAKDEIVLGVNERNSIAQRLYKKAGFSNTGRHFLGPIGELHVYSKKI